MTPGSYDPNGNLLIFAFKSPSVLDPEMRVVLGPFARAVHGVRLPQSLQNAVVGEGPPARERPPRELQAAISRATARDGERAAGPLERQVGRLTAPMANNPTKPSSDAGNKASHKPGTNFSRPSQGNGSAKPRDAARKHWANLAYRALPPAGKDTK
ncbi:uncharacterized protein PV07_10647 [Cladophialophora immunda]|uniref:Uncharacterized protein n=1 Tax=Cladophialophora immunda TaxID=569365 RepID=A0A0D1ZB96_9EURO|nr:uncharacterized protein PV07_10647 [Cladophialophora immunda]KIW24971.1 hypothetical protein PV07_10647 [Cladophialophora immunda]